MDVIPVAIAETLRRDYAGQELQSANVRRLLSHDGVLLADLRSALERHGLDRSGNKAELIARADFHRHIGDANICAHISDALRRAAELHGHPLNPAA